MAYCVVSCRWTSGNSYRCTCTVIFELFWHHNWKVSDNHSKWWYTGRCRKIVITVDL